MVFAPGVIKVMPGRIKDIKTLNDKEKELLQNVLARTGWDLPRATRLLQIPIFELREKIEKHGLKQASAT